MKQYFISAAKKLNFEKMEYVFIGRTYNEIYEDFLYYTGEHLSEAKTLDQFIAELHEFGPEIREFWSLFPEDFCIVIIIVNLIIELVIEKGHFYEHLLYKKIKKLPKCNYFAALLPNKIPSLQFYFPEIEKEFPPTRKIYRNDKMKREYPYFQQEEDICSECSFLQSYCKNLLEKEDRLISYTWNRITSKKEAFEFGKFLSSILDSFSFEKIKNKYDNFNMYVECGFYLEKEK